MRDSGDTARILRDMLRIIDEFSHGNRSFSSMVLNLEAAFAAADIGDEALRQQWFDLWTPLETLRAAGQSPSAKAVHDDLEQVRSFLGTQLDVQDT